MFDRYYSVVLLGKTRFESVSHDDCEDYQISLINDKQSNPMGLEATIETVIRQASPTKA